MRASSLLVLALGFSLVALSTRAEITIAVVGPLSGPVAGLGEEMRTGIDAAVAATNDAGGILGEKVKAVFFDDACNPTQAATISGKVVSSGPLAIIGHLCSSATLAASRTYAEYVIPQITLSSNVQVTESGYTHLFRLMGRDDQQAPDLANYMARSLARADRLAVIDDRGSWGIGFADKLVSSLDTKGVKTVLRDSIVIGQKDFSALIAKLRENDITVVAMGLYPMEAGLFVRQAREQGFKGTFYGGDPLQTAEFWKIAGGAGEGVRISGPFDPRASKAGAAIKATALKHNKPFGVYSYYAYAAVETVADALKQAGAKNSTALLLSLRENTINTLFGPMAFDEKGDLKSFHYGIYAWHEGEILPLSFQPEK